MATSEWRHYAPLKCRSTIILHGSITQKTASGMMEAVRTSETSVDNHSTRQYNPEDSIRDDGGSTNL
jgi:hypothetical protein